VNAQAILRTVSYVTASLVLALGIIIVSGFMLPDYVPGNFRLIMGIVLILYGAYRIVTLWAKSRKVRELEE